jgi:hypothetical protein
MILGAKSTLFLAYAYQFDPGGEGLFARTVDGSATGGTSRTPSSGDKGDWKKHAIKGTALLPHLDEYVRKDELLRAFDVAADLRAAFGAKLPWTFQGDDGSVDVTITDPPRLYTLDTHYAFIVVGVTPHIEKDAELTLAKLEDAAYTIVRAGTSRVAKVPAQMDKWLEAHGLQSEEPVPLRRWLARLVLGLRPDAPRGTPRTTAPALFSVVLAREALSREDQQRLRLVHRSNQVVEPEVESAPARSADGRDDAIWSVSSRELCMFSTFGFAWVVTDSTSSQFLADAPHLIRDRYIYKWLLVEHQRLCLLALATECADMSKGLDQSNFAQMRMRLLEFIATYNFRHISNEERHDRFYKRVRESLSIDDLLAEVRDEVVEIDTQLAARRAETLNHVLAFLTLVLTPVGIMCSIFQTDTLPAPFRFANVASGDAWIALVTHAPFIMVLLAAVVGATIYTRLFGAHVVVRLLRTLLLPKKRSSLADGVAEDRHRAR